jgi:hypothetical protein
MKGRARRGFALAALAAICLLVIARTPRGSAISSVLAIGGDGGCHVENVYVGDGVIRGHGGCVKEGTKRE